ncbi:L-aminoadipate-semialdehyde dehydrogenase-phosphopantetheinyl transferase-like isoform X2 [Argiope bruennichi]|nr:L-aminoadipate-semialdehyde dehydrogenase-phosphopantetheinyl transferase-like isoform X2 [Argiope bruennichi]
MRKVVNECLGFPYNEISFSRSSSGKPFLEKCDGFDFNISHHGDFCVLAAEYNCRVGVDVMKVEYRGKETSIEEYFSLMKRLFSSHEWNFIAQPGSEKEQLSRFYRVWCLKESCVKATGFGLAFNLQGLSFSCPTPILNQGIITEDTTVYENGNLKPQWKFEETFLDDNHCVAVATEPVHQENFEEEKHELKNFVFLTFNDLMQNCRPFIQEEENFWENFVSKGEKKKV